MTQTEKSEIVIEKPDLNKADFVDFEVEREEWNLYRLADNAVLKVRFLLLGVLMDKSIDEFRKTSKELAPDQTPRIAITFRPQTIFAVEPPPNLRGKPDSKKYSVAELKESIMDEDIDFETVKSTWDSYRLKNDIRLKVRLSPTLVSRTSRFDDAGMPIYIVDSTIDMKITMPEDIKGILKQRRKQEKPSQR